MVLDTWTPENQGATLEQIRPSNAYYNSLKVDARLYNGSFIRGKNISLGYNLPSDICKKYGITKPTFYRYKENYGL